MKNKLKEQFNIRKYSPERKWTISIFAVMFVAAIVLLIVTSWFSIDRAMSDWFGGAMLKTNGGFNKLVRGWATYFDIEPYKLPYVFVAISLYIVLETISAKVKTRFKKSWWSRNDYPLFVLELIIGILVMLDVWHELYGSYMEGWDFGGDFYVWTMSGRDVLLTGYIISGLAMTAMEFSLTWYVHFILSRKKEFANGNHWKWAIINVVFFLVINAEYINGLKPKFNRPYEVNLEWHQWIMKIKDLYPDHFNAYVKSHASWGDNWGYLGLGGEDGLSSYPKSASFPWYQINPNPGSTAGERDAFPSGHMSCTLFACVSLFTLFKNPETKGQKITSRVMIAIATLYTWNMVLILEYTWGHWMSDMTFSLVTVPIMFLIWWLLCNAFFYGVEYVYDYGKKWCINFIKNK